MQDRVDVDGVGLDQILAGLVITLGLDALDLGQQLGEEVTQFIIVIDYKVSLAVANLLLYHVVLTALLITPLGYKLAVLHVGLCVGAAQLHAGELHHQAVADIVGILGLVGILVRHDSQLHHLGVSGEIESEEVSAGLLQGRCILAHSGCGYTGQQLA